jgi:hypothetical protein
MGLSMISRVQELSRGKIHILRRTTPSKASVSGNKKAVCAWMADEFDHLADVS